MELAYQVDYTVKTANPWVYEGQQDKIVKNGSQR
jgi:hypothetical protein